MTILISKVGTLIQIRIGVGSATFPIVGPMRGQYFFLMTKILSLHGSHTRKCDANYLCSALSQGTYLTNMHNHFKKTGG